MFENVKIKRLFNLKKKKKRGNIKTTKTDMIDSC